MIYTLMNVEYQLEDGKPVIYAFTRNENGKRELFSDDTLRPRFYAKPQDGYNGKLIKDIFNRDVCEVTAIKPGDVPQLRRMYDFTDMADIRFADLWMIEKKIISTFEKGFKPSNQPATRPVVCFFDIEVKSPPVILPLPDDARWPIVLISVSYSNRDNIILYVLGEQRFGNEIDILDKIKDKEYHIHAIVKYFANEKELIEQFARDFSEADPDIAGGWNSNLYDWPYIIRRSLMINADIKSFSQFNYVDCKKHEKFGWQPRIKGRVLLDFCEIYRRRVKTEGERDTYDFKVVVKDETGYEYEDYGDRIEQIFETKTLLEYGARDAFALKLLDGTIEIIDFDDRIRNIVGCNIDDASKNSRIVTTWLYRQSDKPLPTAMHLSSLPDLQSKEKHVIGALVISPPKGLHANVACFDLKSLYPSLIMAFNLSPERKNPKGEITVPITDSKGNKIRELHFDEKPEGIIPKSVRRISEEREKVRELRKKLEPDDPRDSLLKNQETAIKFIACSFYGAMGFPGFCMYDPDVANAITSLGRGIIILLRSECAKLGYQVLYADSVTADMAIITRDKQGLLDILPIAEIVPNVEGRFILDNQIEVWTRHGFKNIQYVKSAKCSKDIYRVNTSDGIVSVTEDHSLFDLSGKEVKPTNLPDRIETCLFPEETIESSNISLNEAWLLGLICAEGSLTGINKQPVINCDKDTLMKAQKIFDSLGHDSFLHDYTESSACWRLCIAVTARPLFEKCITKLKGWKGRNKKVPKEILNSNTDIQLEFLEGFWTGDGTRYTDKQGYIDRFKKMDTRCHALATGIEYIMYRLGYVVTWADAGTNKLSYGLRIANSKKLLSGTVRSSTKINYDEMVYDICTDDGTFAIGRIVAHNTDSIFVKLKTTNWREGIVLENYLNRALMLFSRKYGAKFPPYTKYEKFFTRLMFKKKIGKEAETAKKRYSGYLTVSDGKSISKMVTMGLEPRRSDASILTRQLMKSFLKLVLQDNDFDKAMDLLRDTWANIESRPSFEVAIPKGLRMKTYKHSNPWIRGKTWMTEHTGKIFREDTKPRLLYVKRINGPLRKFSTKEICITDEKTVPDGIVVDWEKMREKTIRNKMESILDAIGISWDEAMSGKRLTKLEDFK